MRESDLMTEIEAAPEIGLKPKTLANLRSRGEGPPYIRVSRGAVRYSRVALKAWLQERTVVPGRPA